MDPEWLILRSIEVHRCFLNNENERHAYLHLPEIMKIGQITRLANMIRMRGYLPYDNARALSSLLGMQPATFESNLHVLEQLGWVVVHKKQGKPETIEDHIPLMEDVLTQVGALELDLEQEIPNIKGLSEIELGSLDALNMCARTPYSLDALSSETGLIGSTLDLTLRLGGVGRYLDVHSTSDGNVVFSPLYYFNKYEEMKRLFQRQTISSLEPVQDILTECSDYIGKPLELLDRPSQKIAISGIDSGWLIPVNMNFPVPKSKGNFTFLFPPLLKFQDSIPSGDIFEKAKVLISSMRLGEHFTPTSKIKNPLDILKKISREGKLGRPHSDAFNQYKMAASKGMFTLRKEKGISFYGTEYEGWMPYLIDSEENKQVLDTVISLLETRTEIATQILKSDIECADDILKSNASVYESLEYRGSTALKNIKKDTELERIMNELALTLSGGAIK